MMKPIILPLTVLSLYAPMASQATQKPNIVLIMVDDMGYDDLSIHGHPIVETPNLDILSGQSVRFSDFNVSPVSAPTRASLLTGRDFYKTGVSGVHGGRDFLRLEEKMISEVLSENGYATGTWGKWHTGKTPGYLPWDRGFDEAYYAELYINKNSFGYTREGKVEHQKWVSEVITDYAIDFIGRHHRTKPFFAYLSFLAPHEPWEAPDEYVQKYIDKGQRKAIAKLYGMIDEMDYHVGRLMSYLEQNGLIDNTVIIFMSDNGPWISCSRNGSMFEDEWIERNPSGYNGFKGRIWQNGIKSPLFIKYGNTFAPGYVDAFVDMTDLFPFILDFAGIDQPADGLPLDGESFLSALKGEPYMRSAVAFYGNHDLHAKKNNFNQWTPFCRQAREMIHFENQFFSVRDGQYKLILNPSMDEPHYPKPVNRFVLIDMQNDPKERVNIYDKLPEVSLRLKNAMKQRFNEILESEGSLKPPVYLVDGDISVVNAYGPSSTGGGVISNAHLLTNFRNAGDISQYTLRVAKAGRYKVFFDKKDHSGAGFEFRVSSGSESFDVILDESSILELGRLYLDQGDVTLTFEMIHRHSKNPWESLDTVRRFYLVAENAEFSIEKIEVPL
jgi:arylsulfatase A-like enzyme